MSSKKSILSSGLIMTKNTVEAPKETTATKSVSASNDAQPLNFKVSAEFRREFRMMAADKNMKLIDLLYASFEAYKQKK